MEFLKQWTLCVCLTLLIAVIMSLFAPRGNMKGFYKLLISLFVFISFFYPVKDIKALSLDMFNLKQETISDNDALRPYSDSISRQITELLEENGITGADVNVSLSEGENEGEISIDEVVIAVPDGTDKKETEKIVFESLGIEARVIGVGE